MTFSYLVESNRTFPGENTKESIICGGNLKQHMVYINIAINNFITFNELNAFAFNLQHLTKFLFKNNKKIT